MIVSLLAAVIAAATATAALAGTKSISLAPAQYELRLSAEIAEKLSVEAILRSWAEEVDKLGAEAMSALYYQSVEGSRSILMSA